MTETDCQQSFCTDGEEESFTKPIIPIQLYPNVNHWKILLYVPNLVDYLRYYLSIKGMSYGFVHEEWKLFIVYYFVAIAMDVIDGAFARILDQVTRYGTCLDMVCDRASVSMMYFILAQVYPKLEFVFLLFFIVDYGSHYLQFIANAWTKNSSHKNMTDPNENPLVRLYYTNKIVFVTLAFGADVGLVIAFIYGRYPSL